MLGGVFLVMEEAVRQGLSQKKGGVTQGVTPPRNAVQRTILI